MMVSKAEMRRFQMLINTIPLHKLESILKDLEVVMHNDLDAKKLHADVKAEIERRNERK